MYICDIIKAPQNCIVKSPSIKRSIKIITVEKINHVNPILLLNFLFFIIYLFLTPYFSKFTNVYA